MGRDDLNIDIAPAVIVGVGKARHADDAVLADGRDVTVLDLVHRSGLPPGDHSSPRWTTPPAGLRAGATTLFVAHETRSAMAAIDSFRTEGISVDHRLVGGLPEVEAHERRVRRLPRSLGHEKRDHVRRWIRVPRGA